DGRAVGGVPGARRGGPAGAQAERVHVAQLCAAPADSVDRVVRPVVARPDLPRSRLFAWKYYAGWDGTSDRDVECLLGAAMLCRTAQLRALEGFDESVPLYLDDMDLCKRLGELGRLRYLSGVPLLHHYSVSTRKQPPALMKGLGLQATYQYFVKHRGRGYARAYVAIVGAVGLASFPLGLARLIGGSLKKARRRWDEGRVFVDWAWRSKAVTYTLPRL